MDTQWIDVMLRQLAERLVVPGRPPAPPGPGPLLLELEPRMLFDGVGLLPDRPAESLCVALPGHDQPDDNHLDGNAALALAEAVQAHRPPEPPTRQEILFIDPGAANYQTLLAGASPTLSVVVLQADRDGIQQIADFLAGAGAPYTALHILSHGRMAELTLGNARLTADNLDHYADALARWGQGLTDTGDILLYGCEVGEGQQGTDFVAHLARLTGADVAASNDPTGATAKGGDWQLEVTTGPVDAAAPFATAAETRYAGILATSSLDLSSLSSATGFKLNGATAGDLAGGSVHAAGDVNGDGMADLIVGARNANATDGISYVVFGKTGGFATPLDLTSLNGNTGFRLVGTGAQFAGATVNTAGDINGDGIDDLIVSAPSTNSSAGAIYVVFGRTDFSTTSSIDLSSLNGSTNGFRLDGTTAGDLAGCSVSTAGDVNGDGIADIVIGAYGYDSGKGAAYVVFGKTDLGSAGTIALNALGGSDGFRLNGSLAGTLGEYAGVSVSRAGDINGDGFGDLIVGAKYASQDGTNYTGASYVVFGTTSFAATLNLSSLNGTAGVRLDGVSDGDQAGRAVGAAGDINGDSFADLLVGAPGSSAGAGASYVVFGKSDFGAQSAIPLASLNGGTGFRLDGNAGGRAGNAVGAAGDVNGDGLDDLVIGAYAANTSAGASYVVFGKSSFAANSVMTLATLDAVDGFRLDGTLAGNQSGISVSGAGDVNQDGVADLIIGAPGANAAYVVYGQDSIAPTLTITSSVTAVKSGETATITFTFSETPSGFAAADVLTTGGTLSNPTVTANAKVYTATFTPTPSIPSATASMTVAAGTYTDAAGNSGGAGTTPTISIDTLAPSVSTIAVTGGPAADAIALTFRVTFSESVTGVDAGDFALAKGGSTDGTIGTLTAVSGTVYDLAVTGVSGDGALGLNLNGAGTGITDANGNSIAVGLVTGTPFTLSHPAAPPAPTAAPTPAPTSPPASTSGTGSVTPPPMIVPGPSSGSTGSTTTGTDSGGTGTSSGSGTGSAGSTGSSTAATGSGLSQTASLLADTTSSALNPGLTAETAATHPGATPAGPSSSPSTTAGTATGADGQGTAPGIPDNSGSQTGSGPGAVGAGVAGHAPAHAPAPGSAGATEISPDSGSADPSSVGVFGDFNLERDGGTLFARRTTSLETAMTGFVPVAGFVGSREEEEAPVVVEGLVSSAGNEQGIAVEGLSGHTAGTAPVQVEGFGDAGATGGNPAAVKGFGDASATADRRDEDEEEDDEGLQGGTAEHGPQDSDTPAPATEEEEQSEADVNSQNPTPPGKPAFTAQMHPFGSQGFHQASMALLKKMVESRTR
ncbi:MAG: DUF4347 domain-containing protein [Magnetococcus sp. DMHC-8]